MIRTGRVVAEKDGQIEICFERPEACAKCGACAGGKHFSQVKIPGSAPVGSMVAVDMPEGQVLKASAVAYVIPLLLLLAGIALGMLLFTNEGLWALMGLLFMGVAGIVLKKMDRGLKQKKEWQPQIVAIYEEGENKNGTEADER